MRANLEFRRKLLREGTLDKDKAKEIWQACSRDPLFYLATFGYCFEPRTASILPFIPWDYQAQTVVALNLAIDGFCKDIVIEKTRDMGASWCVLSVYQWRWQYKPMQALLLLSRKEDYVDKSEDPDSLFWKVDFLIQNQPRWMMPWFDPDNDRKKLMLVNRENGSTISGDSTTGDTGRGGRKTSIYLDEFASVLDGYKALAATADNTNSRIFVSTPKGTGDAFHFILNRPGTTRIRMHWSQHPEKSKGMYTDSETGKVRSPWYDAECGRRHPHEVAQELDINYEASAGQYFEPAVLEKLLKTTVRTPYRVGELDFDPLSLEVKGFRSDPKGHLKLWMNADVNGKPLADDYFVTADVATGTGASNSVLSGGRRSTHEKILEYANPNIRPEDLARYAIALARWLQSETSMPALLAWEANGPGRNFGDRVIDEKFQHIYYRRKEDKVEKDETAFPGWWSTRETKKSLIGNYRDALKEGDFINPSVDAIEECRQYVYDGDGVTHMSARNTNDPTGAEDNHGDRVIADALLHHVMHGKVAKAVEVPAIPEGSLLSRRIRCEDARKQRTYY